MKNIILILATIFIINGIERIEGDGYYIDDSKSLIIYNEKNVRVKKAGNFFFTVIIKKVPVKTYKKTKWKTIETGIEYNK